MKWSQLNESEVIDISSKEELIAFVEKNCQEYISNNPYWKDLALYRGMKISEDICIRQIRRDRKPANVPEDIHNMVDKCFKNSGFKTNRSNSLFSTGSSAFASCYGTVYVIFPIENFDFVWSKKVTDFLTDGAFKYFETPVFDMTAHHYLPIKNFPKNIQDEILEKDSSFDINDKIASYHLREIFPKVTPELEEYFGQFDGLILPTMCEFISENYQDYDLAGAIASNKEIMISGDKYLAVNANVYKDLMQ